MSREPRVIASCLPGRAVLATGVADKEIGPSRLESRFADGRASKEIDRADGEDESTWREVRRGSSVPILSFYAHCSWTAPVC